MKKGAPSVAAAALWRRLDVAGHEACRLQAHAEGFRLVGSAVFLHEMLPTRLDYEVSCDSHWRSLGAEIHGWIAGQQREVFVTRDAAGGWRLNGAAMPAVRDCVDFDLGFSPATNLFQVHRLGLQTGAAADCPVAWLDAAANTLALLPQTYRRLDATRYAYDAPSVPYAAVLELSALGFVCDYPGLWALEAECLL